MHAADLRLGRIARCITPTAFGHFPAGSGPICGSVRLRGSQAGTRSPWPAMSRRHEAPGLLPPCRCRFLSLPLLAARRARREV